MQNQWLRSYRLSVVPLLVAALCLAPSSGQAAPPATVRALVVVGPSTHPPGTHEVAAGGRVIKYCLEHPSNAPSLNVELRDSWPAATEALKDVKTVVFIGDLFPLERLPEPAQTKRQLGELLGRGCGLVCVHYATGLRTEHVAPDGDHPLLGWLGGYFASGCPHHRSVAKIVTATIQPEKLEHPVLRGWKSFTLDDEPYWNNYFGKDGMASNVASLAFAMLPSDTPRKETVAWAIERPDGGRGVGIVMPHYFRNWQNQDLRRLILNSIYWSAKLDVPEQGVHVSLPDLKSFQPVSVEPVQRPKK